MTLVTLAPSPSPLLSRSPSISVSVSLFLSVCLSVCLCLCLCLSLSLCLCLSVSLSLLSSLPPSLPPLSQFSRKQARSHIAAHHTLSQNHSVLQCSVGQLGLAYIRLPFVSASRIVQELCESRGGRPGLSVLTSLLVSVDVKQY